MTGPERTGPHRDPRAARPKREVETVNKGTIQELKLGEVD
jgi:hypothetical protein